MMSRGQSRLFRLEFDTNDLFALRAMFAFNQATREFGSAQRRGADRAWPIATF
jgi:hypothetical protein